MAKGKLLIALCVLAVVPRVGLALACTTLSATTMNFGNYSVFGVTPTDTTATLTLSGCSGPAANVTFTLSRGSGTFAVRTMVLAANTVNYNISTTAARTNIWGTGAGGSVTLVVNLAGNTTLTMYGRMAAGQDATASSPPTTPYADTITARAAGLNTARTATFQVNAIVLPECLSGSGSLPFGNYDPVVANAAANLDRTGTLTMLCTKGVAGAVALGNGLNFLVNRRLRQGATANYLGYEIYTSAAYTTIWNSVNTVSATSTSKNTNLGGAGGFTLNGRIFAGQDATTGAYQDTVVATVNY